MRKNCGKQLVKKSAAITSKCFDTAVDDIIVKWKISDKKFPKAELIQDMRLPTELRGIRNFFNHNNIHPQIDEIKEVVDNLYLEKLCALPTKDIEDIIWIHNCGKLKRALRTIETLTSELMRRMLMNDSSESKIKGKSSIKKKKRKVSKKKKPTRRKR
jgi:hypothetical protein